MIDLASYMLIVSQIYLFYGHLAGYTQSVSKVGPVSLYRGGVEFFLDCIFLAS